MKNCFIALTLTAALLLLISPASAAGASGGTANQEAKLIAVLKSDASRKEKADACRELAHVGSAQAVPVLASLLGNEEMSHMARYALEPIPLPAVDAALRDALGKVQGRQLAGVITSLGVRRDAKAVPLLSPFLSNADNDLANAAARALGDIATATAVKALESALPNASADRQLALCEGLFRCAESFSRAKKSRDAMRLYDRLRDLPNAAHEVRAGALRGAILARGNNGISLLGEAIRGKDWVLAHAAARTAMELKASGVTKALTSALAQISDDRKILVLQVLGQRADAAALPAVLAAARSGEQSVRIAALRAVAEIGDASGAARLAEFASDPDREIAEVARESLASLPGKKVDDIVLAMLNSADLSTQLAGIDQIARRRMSGSVSVLEKTADSTEPRLRAAALKQLGEFGGEPELITLLNRLLRATAPNDLSALEEALSSLCARIAKPDLCADQVIARLSQASPDQKAALFGVLASVGGGKALGTVRTAVGDANKAIRAAAVETLREWPTADAATDLLALARSGADADERIECLRRYLRWASDSDVPPKQRLEMCKEASGLIQREQEEKLLLAALGSLNSPQAVAQSLPYLDKAGTREEACAAVVSIGERMTRGRNATKLAPPVLAALEKVTQASSNADLVRRAKALLNANQ